MPTYDITYTHNLPEGLELIGFSLAVEVDLTPEQIAEMLFTVTNAPDFVWAGDPTSVAIEEALQGLRDRGIRTWVMNVGDTVVVSASGAQPILVECASFGWKIRPVTDLVQA